MFLKMMQCIALLLPLSACFVSGEGLMDKLSGNKTTIKGIKVADAIYKNGDLITAVTMYKQLLNKDLENSSLWLKYAETLYRLDQFSEALESYEKYIVLIPGSCAGFIGAGRSNLKLARPAAAGVYFENCLEFEHKNEIALIGAAISNDIAGRTALSHKYYQNALLAKPYDLRLRNNYSLSLLLSGKLDEAIGELSQIAFGPGSSVSIRQNLALAYGLKGDMDAAEHVAALDFPPNIVRNNLQYFKLIRNIGGNEAIKSAIFGNMTNQ
ncbi:MAG: tetratricopeptide repeat protein [Sneathiella sp.]